MTSPAVPVVVFGAGGLAREVAWTLTLPGSRLVWPDGRVDTSIDFLGHLDDRAESHGTVVNGHPVLGGADWLAEHAGHAVIVAVGKPSIRKQIVERVKDYRPTFPAVLAPGVIVAESSTVGLGVMALPGAVVTTNSVLGNFVLLNPHASVSHDCTVGDYCSLGPGVSLAGTVTVGEGCDIGTNASAIPGVTIGKNSIIGAGACVVHNLPENVTAVGVPARVRCSETHHEE